MKFAFSILSLENPYFIVVKEGFEDHCKELGVDVVIVDAKYDVAKQVNDIENLIMSKAVGMMISPIDQNALFTIVETAKKSGLDVVSEAQQIDNAHSIYAIDEYEYGVKINKSAANPLQATGCQLLKLNFAPMGGNYTIFGLN